MLLLPSLLVTVRAADALFTFFCGVNVLLASAGGEADNETAFAGVAAAAFVAEKAAEAGGEALAEVE